MNLKGEECVVKGPNKIISKMYGCGRNGKQSQRNMWIDQTRADAHKCAYGVQL